MYIFGRTCILNLGVFIRNYFFITFFKVIDCHVFAKSLNGIMVAFTYKALNG